MPLSRECSAIELLEKLRSKRTRNERVVLKRLWRLASEAARCGQREDRVVFQVARSSHPNVL
jgi:hypothetical protein